MRLIAVFMGIALAFVTLPARAAQYNLSDSKDGYVYSFIATNTMAANSFGPPGLLAVSRTDSIGGGVHDTNSYVQFTMPAGVTAAQVTSATLTLQTDVAADYAFSFSNAPTAAVPFTVDLFAAAASWGPGTTWNTAPAATTVSPLAQQVLTDTSGSGTNPGVYDVTFNVTSLVQSWLNSSLANNGLFLHGDAIVGNLTDGYTSALFLANSYTDPATFANVPQAGGPELTINTVPEPASAALFLVGLCVCGLRGWTLRKRGN